MKHFIRQLRKKPIHIKERIALGTTFAGTLVLVLFWATIVRYEILPKQKLAESKSPFQVIGGIFQNTYKGTVASIGELTGATQDPVGEGKLIVVPQEDILRKNQELENEEITDEIDAEIVSPLEEDILEVN